MSATSSALLRAVDSVGGAVLPDHPAARSVGVSPAVAEPVVAEDEHARITELVRVARAGSAAAFEALVERYEGPLFGFLRLRTGHAEEAEELTQEAFLRAWQKLELYDERWAFSTWLFTLARRLAASRARCRRPRALGDEELAGLHDGDDPLATAADREERSNVWRAASRILTEEQRSALWLRYAEDLSIEEIARILDRRRVTVRVLLFRARAALARTLGPRDGEDEGGTA